MKLRYLGVMLITTACLAGCGGGGGGGGGSASGGSGDGGSFSGSNSNLTDTTKGSVIVKVTNPALPAGTVRLAYAVADQSGNVAARQQANYGSGTPADQLIPGAPTQTDTVTVQALDASNHVLLQGQGTVFVNVNASPTVTVTLGNPNAIALIQFYSQPANVVTGSSLPTVIVGLVTAQNFLAINSTDSVTLTLGNNPGSATASGTLTVTPVRGFATFPGLTLNALGSGYTLVASSPTTGVPAIMSQSFNVVATAGAPSQLVFTVQPFPSTTINELLVPAPQVAVEDSANVIVPGATNMVNLATGNNPSGAFLGGTTPIAPVQGLATFSDLTLNAQGSNFTLTANSSGLLQGTSNRFNMLNDQSGPNPPTGPVGDNGDVLGQPQF